MRKVKNLFLALLASFSFLAAAQAPGQIVGGAKKLDLGATPLTGSTAGGSGTGWTYDAGEGAWIFTPPSGASDTRILSDYISLQDAAGVDIMAMDATLGATTYVAGRLAADAIEVRGITALSSSGTITATNIQCSTSGGAVVGTLNATAGNVGRFVYVTRDGANTCTIGVASGQTLDGVTDGTTTVPSAGWKTFVQTSPTAWVTAGSYLPAGTVPTVGTYAARPSAGIAGQLYFPSDGFYSFLRDSGSAWAPYRSGQDLTLPDDSAFSWVNQGTASVNSTRGSVELVLPAAIGAGHRMRVKTAPATPYTITARFLLNAVKAAGVTAYLGWRDSATGRLSGPINGGTGTVIAQRYSDPSTFNANTVTLGALRSRQELCLRIEDDGTNHKQYISDDCFAYVLLLSESRTAYLATPNQVWWAGDVDPATDDWTQSVHLLSWQEQ